MILELWGGNGRQLQFPLTQLFHCCLYRVSIFVGQAGGTWQIMAAAVGFQVQEFSFAPPYKQEVVQTGFLS
jgi:hypothetical protein